VGALVASLGAGEWIQLRGCYLIVLSYSMQLEIEQLAFSLRKDLPVNTRTRYLIKFKHGDLACLRTRLLEDLSREHFAVLLGKTHKINGYTIINVIDLLFPARSDYNQQNMAFLRIKKDFIHQALAELTNRYDVDTIIDVHTHPFSQGSVSFSATDDGDEKTFFRFLNETFEGIHYASIVFSQSKYSARVWTLSSGSIVARKALLKTQTSPENIASADFHEDTDERYEKTAVTGIEGFFHRSALALGLDVMRTIMHDQVISIVGVGGLGSVVAEHLIHMGFHEINLLDPDVLEMSNLNRVVGAYYEDAEQKRAKVEVVKRHLTHINPKATVLACKKDVHDKEAESVLALSDWIIVATDNHSSRLKVQELSVQYFVPLLSLGVNITVRENKMEDMSGEVITARVGDYLCLSCLNRIHPIKVASERHPDQMIREELVKRGYVTGQDIKEPAVKTLNTFLATMAVEVLVNQYTEARRHVPILVYENNGYMRIYEDRESVEQRNKHCFLCHI
jgi:molybdopterin/thiamine biosynthesis adenylyltransferase